MTPKVSLLKSTALVFLIAIPESMAKAKSMAAQTYDPIGSYLVVALVYLAIVYLLDGALRWLEQTARIPGFEMEGKKACFHPNKIAGTQTRPFAL